jgi:hypothetical protein
MAVQLYKNLGGKVFEMHSRLTQVCCVCFIAFPFKKQINIICCKSKRTSTGAAFRESAQGVMFSTDVSARGLDYPGVSFVVSCLNNIFLCACLTKTMW